MGTDNQPEPAASELEQPVNETAAKMSFELHSAAHLLRRNFDRRARAHGLSRSRWQVLWHLAREQGQKQAELAERLDVAPISLARQLDKLQEEGLVERRQDPADRRCFRIFLTETSKPALEVLRGLARETRSQALEGFSLVEVEQLQRLLGKLRENLV
ncbi:MarR family transcriptional regulator [Microbulbifer flavimaris]|uniref:MarR family transcriptional regulator n=1 Tax=Microbulbifer flavimaris TaxID=1781068 RepID=A0ABX4I031_9GAMM|nr:MULTISPECIES: MarR family transcriptional regulator [Microbulbifer]KUJ83582.1 MarR family transcriptional regulator [Microbulbifer sp. ZGT114]PCO05737.1 MarR family transcriptional regulator [Microbulbifer flavimaris]